MTTKSQSQTAKSLRTTRAQLNRAILTSAAGTHIVLDIVLGYTLRSFIDQALAVEDLSRAEDTHRDEMSLDERVAKNRATYALADSVKERLRAHMAREGITHAELARRIGVSSGWASRALAPYHSLNFRYLTVMAEALDLTVEVTIKPKHT